MEAETHGDPRPDPDGRLVNIAHIVRRWRRLTVTPAAFVSMCIRSYDVPRDLLITKNALPEGTQYAGFTIWDPQRALVSIIVEHPSFDAVYEGDVIPEHPLVEFTIAYGR